MRWFILTLILIVLGVVIPTSKDGLASEYMIYSVYRGLHLGGTEPPPQKDYYINVGIENGIREGMVLQVFRKMASYDLTSDRLYRDVTFPIALVKVIHSEKKASIARLDKMLPVEQTPSISPNTIMVGDLVTLPQ